jgi:hypothetical protein
MKLISITAHIGHTHKGRVTLSRPYTECQSFLDILKTIIAGQLLPDERICTLRLCGQTLLSPLACARSITDLNTGVVEIAV